MSFPPPKHEIADMDRSRECEQLVQPVVAGPVDQAGSAGCRPEEVLLAIKKTVEDVRSTPLPV
jgi:hypothetical protein